MKKDNPILGSGKFTLMQVKSRDNGMRGLGIVDENRFNTHGDVNDRPNIEHVKSLDDKKDIIIYFSNLKGLEALISELEIVKLDMQLEILGKTNV